MKNEPKLTRQTMVVLSILMGAPDAISGSSLAAVSGFASGTLYPILIRLEEAGWISSDWEENEIASPRRRVYRVTGLGIQRARAEAREWKPLVERFV